ncbi:twin transmembrane helix small protein [Gammaproteobacteria bacterium]|nr:twin transmembrane helix small protein [Gammaproteobacteria bacterium]
MSASVPNQKLASVRVGKIILVVFFIAMVASLGFAFYYMMNDRGSSKRTVKALSFRIGIWVVLFGFLLLSIHLGWIVPSQSLPRIQ